MSGETVISPVKGIEPEAKAFLDKINSARGPPIYKMTPADARAALTKVQHASKVSLPPADIEDLSILGGPRGRVSLRIVRPEGSTETLPAIMYFHGGGWVLGDKSTHDRLVREIADMTNSAVVFVDYSRSPEARYPVAIEECYRATEYIAESGEHHRIDGSSLVVAGDSVGGNMAAVVLMMAKQRKGPEIRLHVMFYPVTDAGMDTSSYRQYAEGYWLSREAMKWFWDQYLPDKAERKQPLASPLQASVDQLAGLPPAVIVTGEFDVLRDEGEAYAHKLIEAGVSVTAVRCIGTIHDFVMLNALAQSQATRCAIDLACDMITKAR
ncbi:alpha/beta hydrolase [Methanocella sp. MCL-LM]|uniref:alpha/beta hydrolase n=1 Tax=Methanocella sp. MCL-LM TaxID=3412035 RepID=UPI003C771D08